MSTSSKIQLQQANETFLVTFSGGINEFSQFPDMATVKPESSVVLELQDLTTINSTGIRDFMRWIHSFQSKVIFARNCPRIFIDQINMIKGFIPPNCLIQSFYVPFFNPTTEIETAVLYKQGVNYFLNQGMIEISHPTLTEFELDIEETRYFAFLKEHCR